MKKTFCDRCDYDVTDDHRHYRAVVSMDQPTTATMKFRGAQLDLCVDCARELARWATEKKPEVVPA